MFLYTTCGKKLVIPIRFLQFPPQSLRISKRNFTVIFNNHVYHQHIICFQRFKVISITVTVMPPSDFGVLENVPAITQHITPFKLK